MLAKMKFVCYDFACSEVNRLIYIMGGYGSDGYGLSSTEVYDPNKNEWTLIEKLRKPRGHCFACNYGGKLYMMSDYSSYGMDLCSYMDVYSPDGRSWCELKVIGSVRTCAVRSKPTQCWGRSSTAWMSGGSLSSTPQITLGGRWRCLTKEFRQTKSDLASSTTSFFSSLYTIIANIIRQGAMIRQLRPTQSGVGQR
ncbi:F-box/kelch-repeat protein SKIP20 [Platanthera zijinensis]|uniref:F-box/kelch-repeat protein SKIP20 n=1 Tax=Platanthera zijinensis TaxID=2320716 RepID=A0AAP0BFU4_9ASPA